MTWWFVPTKQESVPVEGKSLSLSLARALARAGGDASADHNRLFENAGLCFYKELEKRD